MHWARRAKLLFVSITLALGWAPFFENSHVDEIKWPVYTFTLVISKFSKMHTQAIISNRPPKHMIYSANCNF